ncbi:MAG: S-layer homology domain-containing protein [Clostridia bacterium]
MKTKKIIPVWVAMCLALAMVLCFSFGVSAATETLYSCGFDTASEAEKWSYIDGDKDGYNWKYEAVVPSSGGKVKTGALLDYSFAVTEDEVQLKLQPEDYAYTPSFTMPKKGEVYLNYDVFTLNLSFAEEYSIYIKAADGTGEREIYSESISSGEYCTSPASRTLKLSKYVNLSEYRGKEVKIGFVYQAQNQYGIGIDNIKVYRELSDVSEVSVNVEKPLIGAAPSSSASIPGGFEGYTVANVSWDPSCSTFEAGKAYSVMITLEAKDGYVFAEGVTPNINGRPAKIITKSAEELKISLNFDKLLDKVSVDVIKPLIGAVPSNTASVSGGYEGYTVANVSWEPYGSTFLVNKKYSVNITLEAKSGYAFDEGITPYINGRPAKIITKSAEELKISMDFRKLVTSPPSMFFDDVIKTEEYTDWFYDDVAFVYYNRLMNGTGDNKFSPALSTTRGMIATVLYRLKDEPLVSGDCSFADVAPASWYKDAVAWAENTGIVKGDGNGLFRPEDPVSRQELAVIFCRFAKSEGLYDENDSVMLAGFKDNGEIADWASDSVSWAFGVDLVRGSDEWDGLYFRPNHPAQRSHVAAMLKRLCTTFNY